MSVVARESERRRGPARALAGVLLMATLSAGSLESQDSAGERLAVPDSETQKEKEKLIRGIFKEEFAKSTAADKLSLSKKLFQQGVETKDDPPTRFVLFREARDLAAEAGDPGLSLKAIDQLAAGY